MATSASQLKIKEVGTTTRFVFCTFLLLCDKIKAIICLGTDNQKIIEAFGNVVDIMVETENMTDAVKTASHIAEKNDIVLLSPCCASFDLFKNYEDRGEKFCVAVQELIAS